MVLATPVALGQQEGATQKPAEATPPTEVVTVSGYLTASQSAIASKKESDRIIDTVAQDQVGLLPDLTVSQAVRRLPGVSVVSAFGSATTRSPDTAESVVIRGFDSSFNLVTLDGAPLASADEDTRSARIGLIPPSLVGEIQAVKTVTSDLEPQGLGGQLNLVTRSAFDVDGQFLTTRLAVGDNSTAGKIVRDKEANIRADATWSNTFGASKRLGLVASASYQRVNSTNNQESSGQDLTGFVFMNKTNSDDTDDLSKVANLMPAPRRAGHFLFDDRRERYSAAVKGEYKFSDSATAALFVAGFHESEEEERWEPLAVGDTSKGVAPGQTETTGSWNRALNQIGVVIQPLDRDTVFVRGSYDQSFGEKGKLSAYAVYTGAEASDIRNMSKFQSDTPIGTQSNVFTSDFAFSWDISSGSPDIRFNNLAAANDPKRYQLIYIRHITEDVDQDIGYGKIDYAWNFGHGARGFGFDLGATIQDTDMVNQETYLESYSKAGFSRTLDQYVTNPKLSTNDPRVPLYFYDDAKLRAQWQAHPEEFTRLARPDQNNRDNYTLDERIYGGYLQASFALEKLRVQAGVRYDRAELGIDGRTKDAGAPKNPDPDIAQYVDFHTDGEYDGWLPSALATYKLTPDLLLRAGYSRTLGRPDFDTYAPTLSVSAPLGGKVTVSMGNPQIRPRKSDNLDLSLEYYFDQGDSLASLALFSKDIEDMIFSQKKVYTSAADIQRIVSANDIDMDELVQRNGGPITSLTLTQPANARSAKVNGFEVSLTKSFEHSLPAPWNGLLLSANYTVLDGKMELGDPDGGVSRTLNGLRNQPDQVLNGSIAFDAAPFRFKLAYNWVSHYIADTELSTTFRDFYMQSRGDWDAQVRYDVNRDLKLVAEVQNIGEEPAIATRFPNDLVVNNTQKGRVFWLGLSWTPRGR